MFQQYSIFTEHNEKNKLLQNRVDVDFELIIGDIPTKNIKIIEKNEFSFKNNDLTLLITWV